MVPLSASGVFSTLVALGLVTGASAAAIHKRECVFTWPASAGDTCSSIIQGFGINEAQFISYNPGVNCAALVSGQWYCVEWAGEPPAPPVTTTRASTTSRATSTTSSTTSSTSAGNGVQTPLPTQLGMVPNCNKFHFVKPDQTCDEIVFEKKITFDQLVDWNPSIKSDCKGLWANVNVCVGLIGSPGTTTKASTSIKPTSTTRATSTGNGIKTPLPIQTGMVKNCNTFHEVKTGDTCAKIGAQYGVRSDRISQWQSVGLNCSGLWLDANVCVRTIGFQPARQTTCGAGNGKSWGDNKAAALTSVGNWCDGNSSTDGSGGFATAQRKTGCYNAPNGNNKILFEARNDFGAGAFLSIPLCNEIVKLAVNNCANGGSGTHEGWWFSAIVVAGRC